MPPPRTAIGKRDLSTFANSKFAFTLAEFFSPRPNSQYKYAFTLAEVLITLGVIGVVAALTLPSLIQDHKKQETSARLKKFYSAMSQAILFAEKDNGTSAFEWTNIDNFKDEDGNFDQQNLHDESYAYWNKYLNPYMKTLRVERGVYNAEDETKSKATKVYFADGSTAELNYGYCIDLLFDTNGDRKPNEYGRDRFVFFITTEKSRTEGREHELYKNQSFAASYLPMYNTREKAINACKSEAKYCSALLQYDNYEFKKDYPIGL